MKKICVVIGSRANYSSIKSAMTAISLHEELQLQLILFASAVLDRYGNVSKLIEADGFCVHEKIHVLLEGETPETMAKSTGLALIELPSALKRLSPDIVVTIGDRFETMATTLAAAYMNIPIAHTMGGEVSGTIDESIRHAVTKFSHIHFPASIDAANRIIKLGESENTVFNVGCPRIDLVSDLLKQPPSADEFKPLESGVGDTINLDKPFLLVSQHPVTTEYGLGERQITATLEAVRLTGYQAIVLWPNSDAGSDDISRGIRKWRELGKASNMHFFKNLPVSTYIRLMDKTICLVGNSSSGIREGAFIGTPVVNIGNRQQSRQRAANVIDCESTPESISLAIQQQVNHGKYAPDFIYGDGNSGKRIASILADFSDIGIQKQISYCLDNESNNRHNSRKGWL